MSEQTMNRFRRNMPTEQDQMNVQNGLDEVSASFGSNNPPPTSLEKTYDSVSPEEIFEVEREAINKAIGDYPTMITTKLEEEERHLEELRAQLEEGGQGGAGAAGSDSSNTARGPTGGSPSGGAGQGSRAPSGPSDTASSHAPQGRDSKTPTSDEVALAREVTMARANAGASPDSAATAVLEAAGLSPTGQPVSRTPTTPVPTYTAMPGTPPQGLPPSNTPGYDFTLAVSPTGTYSVEVSYNGDYLGSTNLAAPDEQTALNQVKALESQYADSLNSPSGTPNQQVADTISSAISNLQQQEQFGNTGTSGMPPAGTTTYNEFNQNPNNSQPNVSVEQTSPDSYNVYQAGGSTPIGTITESGSYAQFTPTGEPAQDPVGPGNGLTGFQNLMNQLGTTNVSETAVQQGGNVTPPTGQTPSPTSQTPSQTTQTPVATPDELASVTATPSRTPAATPTATGTTSTATPTATAPTTDTGRTTSTPTATPQELAQATQPTTTTTTPTATPAATPATPTPTAPWAFLPATSPTDSRPERPDAGGHGSARNREETIRRMEEAGAGGGHAAGHGTHGADEPIAYGEGGTQPSTPIPMMRREEEEGPQIPGAASQPRKPPMAAGQQPQPSAPTQPKNPFQNYQPPQQNTQPVSGLPYKPPGGGGGMKHVHRNRHKSLFDDFFRS